MAELVSEKVDWPGKGRRSKINWDAVADGQIYRLRPGKDFERHIDLQTVQSCAHQAAKRRGKLCKTKTDHGTVIVQFYFEQSTRAKKASKAS